MFIRTVVATILLSVAALASAQVYKWVDEDGVVHYSDQPVEGAERIDLPKRRQPAAATRGIAPRSQPSAPAEDAPADSGVFSYESLRFSTPQPEQTLWNIGGTLTVSVSVTPQLRRGDRLRVYFDGESRELATTQFQLNEVWRGTHNLQAEVIDPNGQLMIRSEPIRFYVQQTSIANP